MGARPFANFFLFFRGSDVPPNGAAGVLLTITLQHHKDPGQCRAIVFTIHNSHTAKTMPCAALAATFSACLACLAVWAFRYATFDVRCVPLYPGAGPGRCTDDRTERGCMRRQCLTSDVFCATGRPYCRWLDLDLDHGTKTDAGVMAFSALVGCLALGFGAMAAFVCVDARASGRSLSVNFFDDEGKRTDSEDDSEE